VAEHLRFDTSAVASLNGFSPVYLPEPPRYGFSRGTSYSSTTRSLMPQHVIIRRARAVPCSVSLSAPVVLVPQTICSAARAPVCSHSSLRGSCGRSSCARLLAARTI